MFIMRLWPHTVCEQKRKLSQEYKRKNKYYRKGKDNEY